MSLTIKSVSTEDFQRYKQWCDNNRITLETFAEKMKWADEQTQGVKAILFKTFVDGVSDSDIRISSTYEQAKRRAQEHRRILHQQYVKDFVAGSPYRQFYVDKKPLTKAEIERDDQIDNYIETVNKYFDTSFFTKSNLHSQFILIREANASGSREGILIKKYPYSDHSVVNIMAVEDACYDVLDKVLEGKQLGIKIRFAGVPTKEDIIDYLCVKDELEKQSPAGFISDDMGRYPYWNIKDFVFIKSAEQLHLFQAA